jgi:hypothetical protein
VQIKLFILILLCPVILVGLSQDPDELSFYQIKKPWDPGEKISIETDRQFYCINEKIYIKADYKFKNQDEGRSWSNVLYVELIRWNGEKIAQAKYKLNDGGASGCLLIPGTVLSGNYYLRAYTRWMRNYEAEEYAYKVIKILNPHVINIDEGEINESIEEAINLKPVSGDTYNRIECFTDKNSYRQRDKIELTLLLHNMELYDPGFCISVARTGSIDTNNYHYQISGEGPPDEDTLRYLPEIRGISISGKIIDAGSRDPIPNAVVNLSIPQDFRYYSTYCTRSNGMFYFTLPEFYGNYDFYIDAITDTVEKAEILIDNDYCNRSIQLEYIPFALDEDEKKVARDMVINMQLATMYYDSSKNDIADSTILPFYGSPRKVYETKEYIKLPNLEEFLFEIVQEVQVIHRKGQTFLKMYGYSEYRNIDPLILIDNIPVMNGSDFLNIPLGKIERVELIDRLYIAANKKFFGLISISTKNKDFAGIKLNENSLFFSYGLFSDDSYYAPDHSSDINARSADRRNLLYWSPSIELKSGQPEKLSFYASDSRGEYTVYIRKPAEDGKPQIFGTCRFRVD